MIAIMHGQEPAPAPQGHSSKGGYVTRAQGLRNVLADDAPEALHHERQVQRVDGVLTYGALQSGSPRLGGCVIHELA